MTLIQSWTNSLALFAPKNFKPFALVTLRTIGRLYRQLWPYILMSALALFPLTYHVSTPQPPTAPFIIYTLALLLMGFPLNYMILTLGARPSAEIKDWRYFTNYLAPAWRLIAAWLAIFFLASFVIPVIIFCLFNSKHRYLRRLFRSFWP